MDKKTLMKIIKGIVLTVTILCVLEVIRAKWSTGNEQSVEKIEKAEEAQCPENEEFSYMIYHNPIDADFNWDWENASPMDTINYAIAYQKLWVAEIENAFAILEKNLEKEDYTKLVASYEGWKQYMENMSQVEWNIYAAGSPYMEKSWLAGSSYMRPEVKVIWAERTKNYAVDLLALEYRLTNELAYAYEKEDAAAEERGDWYKGLYYGSTAAVDEEEFYVQIVNHPIDQEFVWQAVTDEERLAEAGEYSRLWKAEVEEALALLDQYLEEEDIARVIASYEGWKQYDENLKAVEQSMIDQELISAEAMRTQEYALEVLALEYVFTENIWHNHVAENVRTKTSFRFSTEGGVLEGSYSEDGKLQYLSADILGEMGRIIYEYEFFEEKILYTRREIMYAEPYYMNEGQTTIKETKYNKYILGNEGMYDITCYDKEPVLLSEEMRAKSEGELKAFIEELEAQEHEIDVDINSLLAKIHKEYIYRQWFVNS